MTSTPRRPGFRLPWSSAESEEDEVPTAAEPQQPTKNEGPAAADTSAAESVDQNGSAPSGEEVVAAIPPEPASQPQPEASPAEPQPPNPFLSSLVGAMRGVVEEARGATLADFRTQLETRTAEIRSAAETRSAELRRAADREIAAVGEWSTAEMDRIRREAAERVEARRRQLDQELTADAQQTEADVEHMQARMAEYESQLSAFFERLGAISDPAAFVEAAKRMPAPPVLETGAPTSSPAASPAAGTTPEASNGTATSAPAQSVADRLAALTAPSAPLSEPTTEVTPPGSPLGEVETVPEPNAEAASDPSASARSETTPAVQATAPEPIVAGVAPVEPEPPSEGTTTVVVKGLSSFGAITSFKQSLEKAEGVSAVSLSLSPTGEFVYRATHAGGLDLAAAITQIEADAAVEQDPEGGLRVTVRRR